MSTLIHQRSRRHHTLSPTNLIGRSPTSELCFPATSFEVSRFHALIYWAEGAEQQGWWVRDLQSRNGTFVDGKLLKPGRDARLAKGATVAFGARDDIWQIEERDVPSIILLGRRENDEIRLIGRSFNLPHDDSPEVFIFHHPQNGWMTETKESLSSLDTERPFTVGGVEWRAIVCHVPVQTRGLPTATTMVLKVSQDEEYIEVFAERGSERRCIAQGTGNALGFLVFLARQRLLEAEQGIDEAEQGWVYVIDAADKMRSNELAINQWVHRLRKKFADEGLADIDAIERRARTGLLRFGHGNVRLE